MATCFWCGREIERLPWACSCGRVFCSDHRLPENHNCPHLPYLKSPTKKKQISGSTERLGKIKSRISIPSTPRYQPHTSRRNWVKGLLKTILIIGIILIVASFIAGFLSGYPKSGGNNPLPLSSPTVPTPTQIKSNIPLQTVPSLTQSIPDVLSGKPNIDIPRLENRVHQLVNIQRTAQGLPSLKYDSQLAMIARKHSQDMATRNYFSHDSPDGEGPTERGASIGFTCQKYIGNYIYGMSENIFQNNLYDSITYMNGIPVSYDWNDEEELASSTVDGWMNSPGHRQNILSRISDREGIGVAISNNDKVYITEDFC